jgi:Fe-S cluster biosynthesis and repair protein YggX
MDIDLRIAQWENMTQADPANDMAWFSLGSAYKDAERHDEAAAAFAKTLELNPDQSRAYQLRGQVLIQLGRDDEAAAMLTKGYEVAASRGDVMPQRAIGSLLEKLGRPIPQVASSAPQVELGADQVIDRRTGQPQARLADPPMRGPVGRFIYDHFGQQTWREWIGQGTKVINELRLDFSNPTHQDVYDQHMMEWLGFTMQDVHEYAQRQPVSGS